MLGLNKKNSSNACLFFEPLIKHTTMKKITLLVIIAFSNLLILNAQLPVAFTNRLQTVLDSVCTKYKIKGVSTAVLVPNAGVWKGVYGYSHAGVPIKADMLMGMGSNTKTHIAALLLKMQEKGLLKLNDTIGTWIKNFLNISGKITIRQCLNHTSGLSDYLQNDLLNTTIDEPSKIWTLEELLSFAPAPSFAPGKSWNYSNTNYIVAGIIIRDVLKKSPFEALREFILQPNELNNTFNFGEQGNIAFAHPWSLVFTGKDMQDMTQTPVLNNLFSMATTAGALITTAEDNVQFWHKLISGKILSPASWIEMIKQININNGVGYGLGIFRYNKGMNGRSFYSHGGTFFGYINDNMADISSGVCIAALTNQDSIDNNTLLSTLIAALHKVTIEMPVGTPNINSNMSNAIAVYPNPSNESVFIKTEEQLSNSIVELLDMTGKKISTYPMNGLETKIDVSSFEAGIYIICIRDTEGNIYHKRKIQISH